MQYHFCLVKVYGVKKEYYYLDDSKQLKVGDLVEIPFGAYNNITEATINDVTICDEMSAPFSPAKAKKIIRKIANFKSSEFYRLGSKKYGLYDEENRYAFTAEQGMLSVHSMGDVRRILDKLSNLDEIPLQKKMGYAAILDPHRMHFGADSHNYKPGKLLSADEIKRFEQVYGVTLPAEYKDYLMHIRNGAFHYGSIAEHGLHMRKYREDYELLKEEFPYTQALELHNWPEENIDIECDDCDECPKRNECLCSFWFHDHEYGILHYLHGTLPVAYNGCDYSLRLIITGPKKGEVWFDCDGSSIEPVYRNFTEYANESADAFLAPAIAFFTCIAQNESVADLVKNSELFHCEAQRIAYYLGLLGVFHKELVAFRDKINEEYYLNELLQRVEEIRNQPVVGSARL